MLNSSTLNPRTLLIALATAATMIFVALAGAASANAAATIDASLGTPKAGSLTTLNVQTTLTGSGDDLRQYGASINLPSTVAPDYQSYGSSSDRCPAGSVTSNPGSYSPAASYAFDNTNCPADAKIGTVTLGGASGSIYLVNASPLPHLGLYFDSGVTPYGRRMTITWNGAEPTLTVMGLHDTSSSGLTLDFYNASRPNLPTKFWRVAPGDDLSVCTPTSSVTGSVRTYPSSGTTTTLTTATSDTLNITGCGVTLSVTADDYTAGSNPELTLATPLTGSGQDTYQYGATFYLPTVLRVDYPAYGNSSDRCPAGSVTSNPGSYSPAASYAFDNTNCPADAKIGTVTLGGATGSVYWVNASPLPQMGIYFDSGVTPYGRRLGVSYNGSQPILSVYGLHNASTGGLEITFNNPSRPNLQPKVWILADNGDPDCFADYSYAYVRTYPASGTTTDLTSQLWSWFPATGC